MRNALFSCLTAKRKQYRFFVGCGFLRETKMKKNYANDGNEKNEMNSIETEIDTTKKDKKKER